MSMTQCSKCGCRYSHSGQTSCPSCTSHARAYRISTERYSFDSSIYGRPGNRQAYHEVSIEVCREPNQRAFGSRRPDTLIRVVIDDALVIDGNAVASFNGVLNPALPLGQSIDRILGPYPLVAGVQRLQQLNRRLKSPFNKAMYPTRQDVARFRLVCFGDGKHFSVGRRG
jgi:hypothetical protein